MNKPSSWEPCPRCGSARVEIHGKAYQFAEGLGLLVFGAPLSGLILGMFLGSIGIIVGIVVAILGVLMMVSAPLMPRAGKCKDCKNSWTVGKAPSPVV